MAIEGQNGQREAERRIRLKAELTNRELEMLISLAGSEWRSAKLFKVGLFFPQ